MRWDCGSVTIFAEVTVVHLEFAWISHTLEGAGNEPLVHLSGSVDLFWGPHNENPFPWLSLVKEEWKCF